MENHVAFAMRVSLLSSTVAELFAKKVLTADDVFPLLYTRLSKISTLNFTNRKVEPKGVFARLTACNRDDVASCKSLAEISGAEGFAYRVSLSGYGFTKEKFVLFYSPFADKFYCIKANLVKVRSVARRHETGKTHVRNFTLSNIVRIYFVKYNSMQCVAQKMQS